MCEARRCSSRARRAISLILRSASLALRSGGCSVDLPFDPIPLTFSFCLSQSLTHFKHSYIQRPLIANLSLLSPSNIYFSFLLIFICPYFYFSLTCSDCSNIKCLPNNPFAMLSVFICLLSSPCGINIFPFIFICSHLVPARLCHPSLLPAAADCVPQGLLMLLAVLLPQPGS